MKAWLSIPALLGILMLCSPSWSDTIIDFDELFPLDEVTDQYSEKYGITFGTDSLDALANLIVAIAGVAPSSPNVLASAFDKIDGVISFSFSPLVTDVSFTAVSVEDGVTVTYYDEEGQPLDLPTVYEATGSYYTQVECSYSNPEGIGSVVIVATDDEGEPDSFAIDDVTFIPEPATISLLALGVLGLAGRRIRLLRP